MLTPVQVATGAGEMYSDEVQQIQNLSHHGTQQLLADLKSTSAMCWLHWASPSQQVSAHGRYSFLHVFVCFTLQALFVVS